MTMPNFLIIGAQKSGSTSLYYYLKQHPQIFLSPIKEPHFFIYLNQPELAMALGSKKRIIVDRIEYECLFSKVSREIAIGEASPSYLYFPEAANRIREYLPNCRLIAILRNPVDRAFSNYLHAVKNGKETVMDFEVAIQLETERKIQNMNHEFHYIQKGFYARQLKPYYKLFEASQIKVCLFDDLLINPSLLLSELFNFLQVNPYQLIDTSQKYNETRIAKHKFIAHVNRYVRKSGNLNLMLKTKLPHNFVKLIKACLFVKPTIPAATREKLIQIYRDDIYDLQDLINRDLSKWLV